MTIDPTILSVLSIILGWLLGIFSPIIVDKIQASRRLKQVKTGLRTELALLRYRLAFVAFGFAPLIDRLDRQFLKWVAQILEQGSRIAPETKLLENVNKLLKLDDSQLAKEISELSSKPGTGVSPKRYELPYLEFQLHILPQLSTDSQRRLLEIRTHLNIYNQATVYIHQLNAMTFQNLSPQNQEKVMTNLKTTYLTAFERCRIIIDLGDGLDFE